MRRAPLPRWQPETSERPSIPLGCHLPAVEPLSGLRAWQVGTQRDHLRSGCRERTVADGRESGEVVNSPPARYLRSWGTLTYDSAASSPPGPWSGKLAPGLSAPPSAPPLRWPPDGQRQGITAARMTAKGQDRSSSRGGHSCLPRFIPGLKKLSRNRRAALPVVPALRAEGALSFSERELTRILCKFTI